MIDLKKIRGVSIDLDDTLWPIWPTIEHAERELHAWMSTNAPMTAAMFSTPQAMRELRDRVLHNKPDLKHDLSSVRREAIRLAMYRAGDDPLRADEAFQVFFAARQKVELFADVLPALSRIKARYPIVSLSNGNADVNRVGLGGVFQAAISSKSVGMGKPHAAAFEAAAAALDMPCDAVLHVGDDMTLDVLGALQAGMQAVWVHRDSQPLADGASVTQVKDLSELCAMLELPAQ